jgi:hypothetical protein
MADQYKKMSETTLALRLLNARLRVALYEDGKWPAPPGWAFTEEDLEDDQAAPVMPARRSNLGR